MTKAAATIIDACTDEALFAGWFRDLATWRAWFAFLRTLFGLPMSEDERVVFKQCTGRDDPPEGVTREAWLVVGRRGGKSLILALTAVFLACFIDWLPYLAPGERGTVMVIAADRRQARVIYRYAVALLREVPMLKALIVRETAEAIDLKNGITIEILTASFRTVRGYTLIAALCDEIAFWRSDESANPDSEIIGAIRLAMATIPGAMLLCASSPYARRGALWTAFRKFFGKDSPVLLWKADTRTMNPTVPDSVIEEAYENDPASAAAEYGAEFRADVETFVSREVVDAAVVQGRHELPPIARSHYVGFVDPSGGSADSMTLAIAHRDGDRIVLDAVRERRPPFSPDAQGLQNQGGERRPLRRRVACRAFPCPGHHVYPGPNAQRAELLDLPRLGAQLCSLERRTARGGRDSIDHPPGTHDDVANAVAGAICHAIGAPRPLAITPEILAQLSNAPKYRYRPPWEPRNFD
jgi:hypothetical protein